MTDERYEDEWAGASEKQSQHSSDASKPPSTTHTLAKANYSYSYSTT